MAVVVFEVLLNGLPDWREPVWQRLDRMLVQPFVDAPPADKLLA